jgi:ascorbate-specific PTS system EIIC-type component UlaA
MAVHFDFSGKPDGWSSKDSFLGLWILAIVLVNMWLPLTSLLTKKFPRHLINIPNKDYWLSNDERKKHMIAIVENTMAMIFAVVNLIFIYSLKYTNDININGHSSLRLWLIIIPIVFVCIVPIIYVLMKLRIPESSSK